MEIQVREEICYQITCVSEKSQQWFNRALCQLFNFNHEHAVMCCDRGISFDPESPMLYALKSYCQGINYNYCPELISADDAKCQYETWLLANKYKEKGTELEKAFINALSFRVGDGVTLEHRNFDIFFRKEMKKIVEQHPEDHFINLIYCDSIMVLNPWSLWHTEPGKVGQPKEGTEELRSITEKFLAKEENHIGFRHIYIHLMELSPWPEKANDDNFSKPLVELAQDCGHLCHMPSHIFILTGQYNKSKIWNQIGYEADQKYFQFRSEQGLPKNCFYLLY